jgi:hypothetical protein
VSVLSTPSSGIGRPKQTFSKQWQAEEGHVLGLAVRAGRGRPPGRARPCGMPRRVALFLRQPAAELGRVEHAGLPRRARAPRRRLGAPRRPLALALRRRRALGRHGVTLDVLCNERREGWRRRARRCPVARPPRRGRDAPRHVQRVAKLVCAAFCRRASRVQMPVFPCNGQLRLRAVRGFTLCRKSQGICLSCTLELSDAVGTASDRNGACTLCARSRTLASRTPWPATRCSLGRSPHRSCMPRKRALRHRPRPASTSPTPRKPPRSPDRQ